MAGYGFNTGMDGHRVRPLSEADKEEIAEGLKIIYGNARERMLRNVSGRFARGITQHGWAERKANEVLAAHAQLERDMDRAHDQREKLLSGVMEGAYASGSQKFHADMRSVLGETAHISPNSMKAGYILADLNNSLNASERRILRQFDDKYADIIGSVSSEMATGVMTTRQAVGEALIAFADEGIDGFVDRGGHHWTLENYAEMAVLTAIERSTISGYVDTMEEYGYDLAIIDGHAGACPICEAWEGVIVSVSGNNPDYPSLDEAESAGCFHPRCLHGITTYYPDISRAPAGGFRDEPREIEGEAPEYTARSKQRYMERMIRKYKDRAIVAQTPQQKMQAVNKVRQWEDALDDLIEEQPADNYLYRHRSRETPTQTLSVNAPGESGEKAVPYSERGIVIPERNTEMMEQLQKSGDVIHAAAGSYTPADLAMLSHETGVEYTAVTVGDTSYLIRGEERATTIPPELTYLIETNHGTVDAHSHPFINDLSPSPADKDMMGHLPWQEKSVIVDPTGKAADFTAEGATEAYTVGHQHDPSIFDEPR